MSINPSVIEFVMFMTQPYRSYTLSGLLIQVS